MNQNIKQFIQENPEMITGLFKAHIGLEKENVRITPSGEMATTPQPTVFGDKLTQPFFYNDFSESQVELITPVFDDYMDCHHFLTNINDIFNNHIGDELLWPQSAPPVLPDDDQIPIARFGDSEKGRAFSAYRSYLADKYGRKKQMICGLHYNFSFDDDFLKALFQKTGSETSYKAFKNNIYLKISRNFIRYAWLPTYLFGASPLTDMSYLSKCVTQMRTTPAGDPYFEYGTSMRNGVCGYRNHNNFILNYYSVEQYISELKALVADGKICSEKEYYSPIRLKTHSSDDFMATLLETGIQYLEIRILDIDPFEYAGISPETLRFMHLLMIFLLFKEEDCFREELHQLAIENYELVAGQGRKPGLKIFKSLEQQVSLESCGLELLGEMTQMMQAFHMLDDSDRQMFESYEAMMKDVSLTKSAKVMANVWEKGYVNWHLTLAKQYKLEAKARTYILYGCEDLELSTQILIRDALIRGIKVELLDKQENFILLRKDDHIEYIKQATKTRLDSYMTYLIMENKVVTKELLDRANINTPKGDVYENVDAAISRYWRYEKSAFVIKPKSTNFGIGITIFKDGATEADFEAAVRLAFEHDQTVLIEYFVPGKEYRFFVIGDQVVGILHRVPANVTGDGISTIKQLVAQKNLDPLRGKGYKTPLEFIQLGQVERMFLKAQGLDEHAILEAGRIVYLRENSNISTGGDSIDYTDDMHHRYKEIAVMASKAVDATICGVDMMVTDIGAFREDYAIIELNFNPAIHIHCYPYKGKNRDLGNKILDALAF